MFSESFYITVVGVLTTFLGLMIRYCLKSKCSNVNLCYGLININRDVDAEIEELKLEEKEEEENNNNIDI